MYPSLFYLWHHQDIQWVPSNILPADGLTKYNRNYMLFYCDSTISSCTLTLFCKQICYFVNILLFFCIYISLYYLIP